MAGDSEAARELRPQLDAAAFHLKDFAAGVAMKVVMVRLAGYLVACRLAGKLDAHEPLVFYKARDIAVDGRDADALDDFLRESEGLFGRERPIRFQKGGAYGLLLSRVTELYRHPRFPLLLIISRTE